MLKRPAHTQQKKTQDLFAKSKRKRQKLLRVFFVNKKCSHGWVSGWGRKPFLGLLTALSNTGLVEDVDGPFQKLKVKP